MKRSNILKIVRNVVCIILVTFCCIYYVESYLASMGSHGIFAKILNIKTEKEKEEEEESLRVKYSNIKTTEQAASLYDSREYEKTWEKAVGDYVGYPAPPKEILIKVNGPHSDKYDTYVCPYKVNGHLYYVQYDYYKENGWNCSGRTVFEGDNFDFTWIGNNDRFIIVSGKSNEPIIEPLKLSAVGREWAKSVDAENEKALKKILEQ